MGWFKVLQAPADVSKVAPVDGDILRYNSTTRQWELVTIATAETDPLSLHLNQSTQQTITGNGLLITPDTDTVTVLGRAKIGYPVSGGLDYFYLGHYDCFGASNLFALAQGAAGDTWLNSASGQPLRFLVGGIDCAGLTTGGDLQCYRFNNANVGFNMARRETAGSYNAEWWQYIPASSTDIRWYNGADRMTLNSVGTLTTTGGRIKKTRRVTTTTDTVLTTDETVFYNTTAACAVALPAGVNGTHYVLVNAGLYNITITPNGTEKFNGDASQILYPNEVFDITYETTEGWWG